MKKITMMALPFLMMPCLTFLVCSNNAATKSSKAGKPIYLHEQISRKKTRAWEPFLNEFLGSGDVMLVFYAYYCTPCDNMSPVIDKVAAEMPRVSFVKAECELFEKLAQKFDIDSIPTLIFLRNGKEIGRYKGGPLTKKDLAQLVVKTFGK